MKLGKTGIILLILVLATATCMPLVSAVDDWENMGSSGLVTNVNGDSGKRIGVQQETTYWYSASQKKWKEHIKATGTAEYYNDNYGVKQWLPTYGDYGVYIYEQGYIASWTTYGDKTVYFTTVVKDKTQYFGQATLFEGDVYSKTGPDGKAVSVTVAGVIGSRGVKAESVSQPKN